MTDWIPPDDERRHLEKILACQKELQRFAAIKSPTPADLAGLIELSAELKDLYNSPIGLRMIRESAANMSTDDLLRMAGSMKTVESACGPDSAPYRAIVEAELLARGK